MTLNDVLTKQNVITKVILKDGDKELPKELKVKIMRIRMAYNKIKKQFDDDTQEFANQIITDELRRLSEKTDRTPEEDARFNELNDKTNSEYQEYLVQKGAPISPVGAKYSPLFTGIRKKNLEIVSTMLLLVP